MFPFHCLLAATVLDSKIRLEFLFLFPWRQCMLFPSSVPSLVFSDLTMECPFMTFFASASLGLCSLLDLQVGVSVNSGCFRPSSHQIFTPILFIYTERGNCSLLSHRSLRLCSFCVWVSPFSFYIQASDWSFYRRFSEDTGSSSCHIWGTVHLGRF